MRSLDVNLTDWQRRLVEVVVSAVPRDLRARHGRCAGWTTALRVAENLLKSRGETLIVWGGRSYDPDSGEFKDA